MVSVLNSHLPCVNGRWKKHAVFLIPKYNLKYLTRKVSLQIQFLATGVTVTIFLSIECQILELTRRHTDINCVAIATWWLSYFVFFVVGFIAIWFQAIWDYSKIHDDDCSCNWYRSYSSDTCTQVVYIENMISLSFINETLSNDIH